MNLHKVDDNSTGILGLPLDRVIIWLHDPFTVYIFRSFKISSIQSWSQVPTNSGESFLNRTLESGLSPLLSTFNTPFTIFLLSSDPGNYFHFRDSCKKQRIFFFPFSSGNTHEVNWVIIIFLNKTMHSSRKSRDFGKRHTLNLAFHSF